MDEQGYYLQPQQSSNLGIQSQLQQQQQQQQQPTTQQQMNQQPSQQQSQQQQGNINNNNNINTPLSYTQNLNGYQNGGAHQMAAHIPFHPQNHPAAYLAAGSQHLIDYSQLPGNQAAQQNYSLPTHYTPQLHHGYGQQPDQYLSQSYQQQQQQQPFEYDPSNQLNTLSYYAPQTGVNITAATTTDSSAGAGNIIPNGLQAQSTYGQYPPPLLSSQQHYQLDPNSQSSAPYGQQQSQQQQQQYHAHQISHPVLDQTNNYLQFGQQNTYPGGQNHPYLPFNTTMQSIHNGQIHTHSPYGLLSNPNQIGLIDPSLQGRQQQPQQIGKASIKSEEQAMENELNLLNSLGDSQSQIEDKLKQNNGQFMVPQTYEQQQQQQQQQAYQYYALGSQNFQGYPTYPQGQIQQPLQQVPSQQQQQQPISPLQAPGSANSLKDKDEKRQPNSPGRKKAIKKGSPTTEPSSPASPRGRKRKNTGKNGELEGISPTLKPSGLTLIQQSSQPVQSQNSGAQFGLHLMKVPSQPDPFDARKQQLGFLGNVAQPNYGQLGIQNNMMLDPGNMQQISNIDQSSLQRLKELPTDFNLSDFAGVNDEQKQIGTISKEERKQKIKNYQEKRKKRSWAKKISYDVRKKVADSRLRDKGRFVTKKQAMEMLSLSGREEEFTMDQLKEMLKQRGILQPTGGDEDSKSPTFQSKNPLICSEQPRRLGSLKPGEEYEGQEFDQEVRSEEQLPNDGMLVLNRGRSCEGNLLTTTNNNNNKNEFAGNNNNSNSNISQNLQFFSEMVKNSNNNNINSNNLKVIDGNSNENGMINNSENQLLLKLEQKENDNLNKPFKQASQQQLQQQQQQQQPQLSQQPNAYRQYSQSPPQSQSPLRSPNKQNNNLPHKLIELIPTQQQQQSPQQQQNILSSQGNLQEGIKSNSILQQDMLGNTNQPNNNFPIETQESSGSQNNILSQEVADQFGNLNIKSPDQKHQKLIANNPQMISLAEQSGTNNHFFGGQQQQQQQQQNYILHNGQQPYSNVAGNNSNNNNTGYPIHQQQ